MHLGPGASLPIALGLAWRRAGTEETYKRYVKRLAFASRYGHAGEWMFRVSSDFLQDFVEAVAEIVSEENRSQK